MLQHVLFRRKLFGGGVCLRSQNISNPLYAHTKESIIDLLNNPVLWSDPMIQKTLQRVGAKPFDIEDVRLLIKDYLTVLAETVRKETF